MIGMRHWSAVCLAAMCGLLLSACASTVSGVPVRATSRPGDGDELSAMLLRLDEVQQIVGVPEVEIRDTYERFIDYAEFSPDKCAGVPFNTIDRTYRNSGFQAVRGMRIQTWEDVPAHWVDEGVVGFPTADAAHRFVTESKAIWRECARTVARVVPDEETGLQVWAIGDTEELHDADGLVVASGRADVAGRECSHAMAAKAKVVVDVVVCMPTVRDEAVTILHRIASRPPV
jgi:serine/threonine kinase PknH